MSFTTVKFLIFFAIVFWGYFLIPKKFQWTWLLAGSLIFYAFSAWWALFYLLGTIGVTYLLARLLDSLSAKQKQALSSVKDKEEKSKIKSTFEKKKRGIVILELLLLVGLLVVIKYTNFIVGNVAELFRLDAFTLNIVLPVGLSFYIFQNVGYLIDVSRGQYPAETNFFKFALYISYFPHVLQGPLDDYQSVSAELYASHDFDEKRAISGAKRAAWGFFKKLVIANQISVIVDNAITVGGTGYEGLSIVVCMILYAFELYADFSGYMDVAIGVSRMLGIEIAENFDAPYLSGSIAEFWRRWHITLGTWFKNYVFYSVMRTKWNSDLRKKLKKNKYLASTLPTVLALVIVWLLIGLWHGASWSYVLYGIYHGFFVVMDTVLAPVWDKFHKKHEKFCASKFFHAFRIVRTFVLVTFGYYLFAPAAPSLTMSLVRRTFNVDVVLFGRFILENLRELIVVGLSLIPLVYADFYQAKGHELPLGEAIARKKPWVKWLGYVLFLFAILFLRAYDVGDAFAYFKF